MPGSNELEELARKLRARRRRMDAKLPPPAQGSLFGPRAPKAGRVAATIGARAAADQAERISAGYKAEARAVVLELVGSGLLVTSEDVRDRCPAPEGADPRALGHVFRELSRDGKIERAGVRESARAEHHGGLVAVWKAAP